MIPSARVFSLHPCTGAVKTNVETLLRAWNQPSVGPTEWHWCKAAAKRYPTCCIPNSSFMLPKNAQNAFPSNQESQKKRADHLFDSLRASFVSHNALLNSRCPQVTDARLGLINVNLLNTRSDAFSLECIVRVCFAERSDS